MGIVCIGDSGSPILNENGKVIGALHAKFGMELTVPGLNPGSPEYRSLLKERMAEYTRQTGFPMTEDCSGLAQVMPVN